MIKKLILGALALLLLTGCQEQAGDSATDDGTLRVVCTVGMIADIVREISGETVSVENIVGSSVDPHVYKPTSSDVKKLQAADLILYNGLHLEGKMGDILSKLSSQGKPVTAVAEKVISGDAVLKDEEGESDPHLWMDVSLWSKVAEEIHSQLSAHHEDGATLAENHTALQQKLTELDAYAKKCLSSIPESQRELITAHDAFGYMEKAYGLRVRGIQGLSTESETGLKELEELINYIIEKNIPSVFIESSVNDKNVKALQEGAKAKGHTVEIGGTLFSDAMGPAGTYEGTYIGMIDHNITLITRALGGTAPAGGMQGKLKQ